MVGKRRDSARTVRRPHEDSAVKASVFVGTSLDGFIARANGDLDFLPAGGGEPHGYDEFMATVDALVIGRKTFETALTFETWPYGEKRVFVLSTRPRAATKSRVGLNPELRIWIFDAFCGGSDRWREQSAGSFSDSQRVAGPLQVR